MNKEQKQAICLEYKFASIVGEYYNDNNTSNKISIYSDAITLHFTLKIIFHHAITPHFTITDSVVNVESNFGGHIRLSAEKIQEDLLYMINLINNIEPLFLGLSLQYR